MIAECELRSQEYVKLCQAEWELGGQCADGNDTYKFPKAYNISPYASNCMKSNNPHSGIQEITTTRTLDLNGGNPACNQGGVMIVEIKPKPNG